MTAIPLLDEVDVNVLGEVSSSVALGDTVTGTIDSNGDTVVIELFGAPTVLFTFVNSAFSGTVLSEGSLDGGVTYGTILSTQVGAVANVAGSQAQVNAGMSLASVVGMTHFRIRVSAYTSGSAVATMRTAYTPGNVQVISAAISQIVPGNSATQLGKAEDSVHTSGDVGVAAWAVQNSARAVFNSNDGDYSPLGVNRVGAIGVTILSHASSAEAPSSHRLTSAGSTNATVVKASNGNLYRVLAANGNAAARFLKFYNKATTPTVGTDVPVMVLAIPAGDTLSVPLDLLPFGFNAGISYALTTGIADADTGAVAAGEISLTLQFV